MSTHSLCFEQKYEKYHNFLSEKFPFLDVNRSIYLNRRVFVMSRNLFFRHIYMSDNVRKRTFGHVRLEELEIRLRNPAV